MLIRVVPLRRHKKEDEDLPPIEGFVGLTVGSIPDSEETEKLEA